MLITGKIAESSLRKVAQEIGELDLEIKVLNCTVAALMSTEFIARELRKEISFEGEEIVVIPGLCQGPLEPIIKSAGRQVWRGPQDLRDLPAFFQRNLSKAQLPNPEENQVYHQQIVSPMKILAEIVNAPRMSTKEILERAAYYRANGADIIDLGGDVDQPFPNLQQVIKDLKSEGFQVSMDSHQKEDILAADRAGADLILSLTSHNIELAKGLNCPVVIIPDEGQDLSSLFANIKKLEQWKIPYLIDPILPPLTMGLAEGIGRYLQVRKEFPDCELLMGLGNVTELIDADSIGINALLVGIAGELQINYILTTEVSHRALGSVQEIDLSRQLIRRAQLEGRVPKNFNDSLLVIKDPAGNSFSRDELWEMHQVIRDKNYRIFVADRVYIFNAQSFFVGTTAQELFVKLDIRDPQHAFYLGRELEKAELALRLGKKYVQDNPLHWGYLGQNNEERSRF